TGDGQIPRCDEVSRAPPTNATISHHEIYDTDPRFRKNRGHLRDYRAPLQKGCRKVAVGQERGGSRTMRRSTRFAVAAAALGGIFPALAHADILSAKRGFADSGANYNDLQATGAGWYYTWGTGAANPGNFDAKFYPMFWNSPSQTTINNVKASNPS